MKGKSTITFNQATMVEAVQTYLKTQFRFDYTPKVTLVRKDPNSFCDPEQFLVEVDADQPADENAEEESDD